MNNLLYFLHIPKTGGTSFISFLDSQFKPDNIFPGQLLPELFQVPEKDLARYKFYRGHLWHGLNSYLKKSLDYLTILRDPLERTISWYLHVKRDENAYRHDRVITENWSLLDFINDEETNWDTVNAQTLFIVVDLDYARLARDPVGYGQAVVKQYASRLNDRALLEAAKQRLEKFLFFGITERMQDSIYLLSYVMNWRPAILIPNLNVSPVKVPEVDISLAVKEAIKKRTCLDQELYEWACQIFEERFNDMIQSLLISRFETRAKQFEKVENRHLKLSFEQRCLFRVAINEAPEEVGILEEFQISVEVSNFSRCEVDSLPPHPVHLSYHWIDSINQSIMVFDGKRTAIMPSLFDNDKRDIVMLVEAPPKIGLYKLRVTLVQEEVAWFDENGTSVFSDINMQVR